MTIKKNFTNLLKKILPIKIVYKLIYIRDIPEKIKINYSKYILRFLKTDIYDEHRKKKLFSLRNFGGSTISRGFHLFSSQPGIAKWIESFDEKSCFVDIGANIGIYSLYAATKKHKVLALEPESLNFACLNLNIFDNNFQNYISAYPICIDEESKISKLNMRVMKFGGSASTFDRCVGPYGETFKPIYEQGSVSSRLDDIVKREGLNVNYIKIDVDGNELRVIKSMPEIIKSNNLKSICIELNPNTEEGKEVIEILSKDLPKFKPIPWYKNQEVVDYIFEK